MFSRQAMRFIMRDGSGLYSDAVAKDWKSRAYSLREFIWAIRRGFTPSAVRFLGITRENVGDYLPQQAYYARHPFNRWSVLRVNDKLTIRYALSDYREYLPAYYALVIPGGEFGLPDCRLPLEEIRAGGGYIPVMARKKNRIVVKRLGGCGGEGFSLVEDAGDEGLRVNGVVVGAHEYVDMLARTGSEFIVTEEIVQHEKYRLAWSHAAHCFRIQTARIGSKVEVLFNFARFGSLAQKYCTGHTLGGALFGEVNESGCMDAVYRFDGDRVESFVRHPDTGQAIAGEVPFWSEACSKLVEIHSYLSDLDYLGWDVVITDRGFKILEVNSLSAIEPVQFFHPIMRDARLRGFFMRDTDLEGK